MKIWTEEEAKDWYVKQPWLVGCNFLPSSAINQLEMFQNDTFDEPTLTREIKWASELGFNTLRIYLHDLLWKDSSREFCETLDAVLEICSVHKIRPILVLFDDCHRPYPKLGIQPRPVKGVHNSGWKQSPGREVVHSIYDGTAQPSEIKRLKDFVQGLLAHYKDDERILMWDIYNEPGQLGVGEKSITLLKLAWEWAHEIRPSQPLSACLDGSVGEEIIHINTINSDVITFHTYEGNKLEETIKRLQTTNRPLICTEYMAREFGTTFQYSMPIFKKHNVGCCNWGLVAGKSQTHFGWATILELQKLKQEGVFLSSEDQIPEPEIWFHDILRKDGSAFDEAETAFIQEIIKE